MVKKKAKKAVRKVKRKKVILPMKLSSLIGIALRDIRRAEAMPKKFVVDMDTWFKPETVQCKTDDGVLIEEHKVCTMCAAGSVMAFSLGALGRKDADSELFTESFPGNQKQLEAINYLRDGNCLQAARTLWPPTYNENSGAYIDDPKAKLALGLDTCIRGYYRHSPEPFHKDMAKFQAKLEKAGL